MWQLDYYSLILQILTSGHERPSRAGLARSLFGCSLTIQPFEFPILEVRRIYYKGVLGELAAMLQGANTLKQFKDFGCNYWDAWADAEGNLNLDYGVLWRNFNGVDQLKNLIEGLKNEPYNRRHIITGWRPDRLNMVALPCCHLLYQWYIDGNGCLNMLWYQRSVDVMVGLPSDVLFAVVWNSLVANTVGLKPGVVKMVFGDAHIYANHLEGAEQVKQLFKQRSKDHKTFSGASLTFINELQEASISLDTKATVFNFDPSMVEVLNYNPDATIKLALNV